MSFNMKFTKSKKSLLTDTWLLETISVLFSALALAVIFALLNHNNQKPIFKWHDLTLNTLVSIFTTIAKTLLMFTVSSCIGQWKYITFSRNRRKLIEFATLDSASRGPKGSFDLLWQTRFGSFAAIGAVLTILSLAIDPFAQQIIGLGNLQVPTSDATVAQALRYSKGSQIVVSAVIGETIDSVKYDEIISTPDFPMQSAILSGLSNSFGTIAQQISIHCSSGDCRWQPYLSLAVCSTCSDITHSLEKTTKNYTQDSLHSIQVIDFEEDNPGSAAEVGEITTYGFPNGLHMDDDAGDGSFNVSMLAFGTSNRSATVTFQNNEMMLWSMTMIRRLKSTGPLIPQATECGLFYCVKNYTSQVTNGSISESSTVLPTKKSINSWQPLDGTPDPSPDSLSSSVDYARTDLQLNGRFNISQVSINAIGSGMETVFVGSNSSATGATGFALIGPDGVLRQYAPESMQPIYQSTDLNELFNNLAVSMTNNMRSNDDNGTTVVGTTGITVYEIRWPWISLPLIGVILGCVFLAITAGFTKAQNLPIWKSSSLAVLKCGTNVQSLLADETYVGGMTNTAKGANISFFNSEDGEPERGLKADDEFEMQTAQTLGLREGFREG